MAKRSTTKKKVPTEVWVALIGLVGVIIAAILSSPLLIALVSSTSNPTAMPTQALSPGPGDTPTPTTGHTSTPSTPSAETTTITDVPLATPLGCTPSGLSELPPQSVAIIESDEGIKSRVPLSTLEYERMPGLRLASGTSIDFRRMRSFELSNKDFLNHFTADVVITFLDCKTHQDVIESESGSFLSGETEIGKMELHILKVRRVDFQW
jgi:hypothetical protein